MTTIVENVASMIGIGDQLQATPDGAWRERAAKLAVIILAFILMLPVMLTFAVLALCVARIFGVPVLGTALPKRPPQRP